MKIYIPDELKAILEQHRLWLKNDSDGARANLTDADLSRANLSGAILSSANLRRANLSSAKADDTTQWPDYQICSQEGAFIAYKSVRGNIILTLEIPADAARTSSLVGRKCRASKVKVLKAENYDGSDVTEGTELISHYDNAFLYKVGATATVADFNADPKLECTRGIHFFVTRKEAEQYQ